MTVKPGTTDRDKRMVCTHTGTFAGRGARHGEDTFWRVEIWRKSELEQAVRELSFPGEEPLVIEWDAFKPEEPLQGSQATLKVVSLRDREFIDLYCTGGADIVLKVYRRGWHETQWMQVWRGALDPEFYEEPFETLSGYDVTLTFSDFGTLDRIPFDPAEQTGTFSSVWRDSITGQELISACLCAGGLADNADESRAVVRNYTTLWGQDTDDEPWNFERLDDITVKPSNFIDEEGKKMSCRKALEGFLLPFGGHLVQRGGGFTMFTVSDACTSGMESDLIHWSGETQTLGTAEHASKVTVTFSPYLNADVLSQKTEPGEKTANDRYWNAIYPGDTSTHLKNGLWESFELQHSNDGKDLQYNGGRYARIVPLLGGASNCTCIRLPLDGMEDRIRGMNPGRAFTMKRAFVPKPGNASRDYGYMSKLVLKVSMLYDPRYNPFESEDPEKGDNKKEGFNNWKDWGNWLVVPCRILLKDSQGNTLYYYTMEGGFPMTLRGYESGIHRISRIGGRWEMYEDNRCDAEANKTCYLQWYCDKWGDRPEGWTTNREPIGLWPYISELPEVNKKLPEGMSIPLPPVSGFVEVTVFDIVLPYPKRAGEITHEKWPDDITPFMPYWGGPLAGCPQYGVTDGTIGKVTNTARWWMFKDMEIKCVKNTPGCMEWECDDIETVAETGEGDEEEVSVATVLGTAPRCMGVARGSIMAGRGFLQYVGNGNTRHYLETVLASSVLSHYAQRRFTLSGEALESVTRLPLYRDHNMPGQFIMSATTLDAIGGTEELSVVEAHDLNYDTLDPVWRVYHSLPGLEDEDPHYQDDDRDPDDWIYGSDPDDRDRDDDEREDPWEDWGDDRDDDRWDDFYD